MLCLQVRTSFHVTRSFIYASTIKIDQTAISACVQDYAEMEITWDNGNTTTTRWDGRGPELFATRLLGPEWFVGRLFGPELFVGTCQGKTQRQIDLDIYHGRVEGYNHWQRIGARHSVDDAPVRIRHRLMY